MNKAGLIEKIADQSSVNRKDVEKTLDTMIETIITELLNGGKVNIVGFGSFEAKTRHARGGINPQKPTERITIPEVRVAKFKTGKTLKDALKGKISVKEAVAAVTAPVVEEKEEATAPEPTPVTPSVVETMEDKPVETTPVASVEPKEETQQ